MSLLLSIFKKIPIVNKIVSERIYACGAGTFTVNLIFKYLFCINKGLMMVHFTSRVVSPRKIKIIEQEGVKKTVNLSFATSGGCYYQAKNGISIGEGTIWAYNCSFISSNHDLQNLDKHLKGEGINIGKGVWIGANCVVLPKVRIGDGTIVGAGSVVTKSFPSNVVIAGNPAKIIKEKCRNCSVMVATGTDCNCSKIV